MSSCISILGSTGSIGRQTLDVVDKLGLRVAALTANRDVDRLEAQCRKYRPKLAAMMDEAAYKELKARLSDMNITVVLGLEGLITAASLPEADTVVTAVWIAVSTVETAVWIADQTVEKVVCNPLSSGVTKATMAFQIEVIFVWIAVSAAPIRI